MRGRVVALSGRSRALGPVLAVLVLAGCRDVTVSPSEVTSVELSPNDITLIEGESYVVSVTLREQGGQVLEGRPVTWSSDDPAVASVSGDGLVEGVEEGSTVIRAAAGAAVGTAEVVVLAGPSIDLPPAFTLDARPGREERVSFAVENGGNGELTGLVAEVAMDDSPEAEWLSADLDDSHAPTTLRLALSSRAVGAGTHRGRVIVSSAVARNSPQALEVTFEVRPPGRAQGNAAPAHVVARLARNQVVP